MRASLLGFFATAAIVFPNSAIADDAGRTGRRPQVETAKAAASDKLRQAGMNYAEACNFENARAKLEEDIALNTGFDKDRLPESYLLLGDIYRLQGSYPEASEWTAKGVSILEKEKSQDKKRLSAAYNYLALLKNSAGDFSESEKNARKALALAIEAGLGKDNEAMHRVVLANALRQQGKFKEALPELEAAISVLRTGKDRRLFAGATNNLGALYFWMGDYQKALPTIQDGLKQRLELSGENHPDVANSYLDLGCVEFKLGDVHAALEHLQEAHEIRLTKLGAKHPETLSSSANLAVVLLSTGELKRALELLSQTVENGKVVLGVKNPDLAQYEDDYAHALAQDKQFDLARTMQSDANAIRKSVFGSASREYAAGLRSMAQIESSAGNKKPCLQLLLKSLSIYTERRHYPDQDLAETLDEIGFYYAENGELEKARQTFVLAIREKLKTGNKISYATSLANLAELLQRMNHTAESAVMLKKAVSAIQTLPDEQRETPDCKAILERYQALQNKN